MEDFATGAVIAATVIVTLAFLQIVQWILIARRYNKAGDANWSSVEYRNRQAAAIWDRDPVKVEMYRQLADAKSSEGDELMKYASELETTYLFIIPKRWFRRDV